MWHVLSPGILLSDGLQIQLTPPFFYNIPLLVRERLGYVLGWFVEPNWWHVPETRRDHEVPDSWFILFFRHSWPRVVRCRSPLLVQDHHIHSIPSPVCPFCPVVTVPNQVLILMSFGKENKKSIKKKCHIKYFPLPFPPLEINRAAGSILLIRQEI